MFVIQFFARSIERKKKKMKHCIWSTARDYFAAFMTNILADIIEGYDLTRGSKRKGKVGRVDKTKRNREEAKETKKKNL